MSRFYKLTERQEEVLRALAAADDDSGSWHRPMDIGGSDSSHHSRTLNQLVRREMVESRPRDTLLNYLKGGSKGCSKVYRITMLGYVAARITPPYWT